MQTFETARLLMRPLQPEDESFYCTCYTDPVLMQHIGEPLSPEAASRSFAVALKITTEIPIRRYTWVMQEKSLLLDIGLLALVCDQAQQEPTHAEIGAIIFANFQNLAYAAEAISALTDLAFNKTTLATLRTEHTNKNGAACGLMEKLGFQRDGMQFEQNLYSCWHLHRADWQQRQTSST